MLPSMFIRALLFATIPLLAQIPSPPIFTETSGGSLVTVQNSIAAQVNGKTISMMDVKKKMDMIFHQRYPHLKGSPQTLYQFYTASWRPVLMEMIDNELILADAADHEIQVSDAEVREAIENRFGPNTLLTLDEIGLSFEEAARMMREEMIVQRMSWWFIQAKAMQKVTPGELKQAYRAHIEKNPSHQELAYRIVSVRGEKCREAARKIHQCLIERQVSPELIADELTAISPQVHISPLYTASDLEISETHKRPLATLSPGDFSAPITQKSRTANQHIVRIFYLAERQEHRAPTFQELGHTLREELMQKALVQQSQQYVQKLRKRYGFDPSFLQSTLPEDMHPFSIQ